MSENRTLDILISVDGEFTGAIPGPYSMISLGAVAYNLSGTRLSDFKVNLKDLPGSTREPATMGWWSQYPDAWKLATENSVEAGDGMARFAHWLNSLGGRPKLMGWPLPVDFMFVYWYYVNFIGFPPFGYDGVDIKTYAMRTLNAKTIDGVSRAMVRAVLGIPDTGFSHDSLDDASQQADLYFGLQKLRNR